MNCDATIGRQSCGEPLRRIKMPDGTVRMACLRCMAREVGRCWQCGKVRENAGVLAIFCTACAAQRKKDAARRTAKHPPSETT